jgi:predicted DNA-binding WGR domain protein
MEIEQTIFGEACLEEEAVQLFLELLKQKRGRGYRPKTTLRY